MGANTTWDTPEGMRAFDAAIACALQVGNRRTAMDDGPFLMGLLVRVQAGALVDAIEIGLGPAPQAAPLIEALVRSVLKEGTADMAIMLARVTGDTMGIRVRSIWREWGLVARRDELGYFRVFASDAVWRSRDVQASLLSLAGRQA